MRNKILIALGMLAVILAGLWIWLRQPDEAKLSVEAVMGKRPKITAPRDQTFPTVQIADAVGWAAGAAPTPAAGLSVQAFARNLDHPRWLYRLPNGDVLVAEANSPKREGGGLTGAIMNRILAKAGAGVPSANRITLLRDADGDGVAESRTVLISGLTVMAAMAGMYFGGAATFSSFATGTIIVVATTMLASLTVLPALMSRLGTKVDRGRIPGLGRLRTRATRFGLWSRIVGRVTRRPLLWGGLTAALLVLGIRRGIRPKPAAPGQGPDAPGGGRRP